MDTEGRRKAKERADATPAETGVMEGRVVVVASGGKAGTQSQCARAGMAVHAGDRIGNGTKVARYAIADGRCRSEAKTEVVFRGSSGRSMIEESTYSYKIESRNCSCR